MRISRKVGETIELIIWLWVIVIGVCITIVAIWGR